MQTLLRIVGTRYYCPKCDVKRSEAIIKIDWKNGTPKVLFCKCCAEQRKAA